MIDVSRSKRYPDKAAAEWAERRKTTLYTTERFNHAHHVTIREAENMVSRNNGVKIVPLKNGADGYALKGLTDILALSFALRDADDHLVPCFRRADIARHDKVSY